MKKNNSYLVDDEIDLRDLIKSLWREKISILSISIICGLAGYLYASFQPQEFKAEITIKNPPPQLFESYNINNNNITEQFISNFKINISSLDNLQSFVEESREFDNLKEYLKSNNISVRKYFKNNIDEVYKKDLISSNKYFLVFTKELDGDLFLKNYIEFIKKKTVLELKKNLKLSIENKLTKFENAFESAKLISLENPIPGLLNLKNQSINETEDLFYYGSKVLSQEIIYLKKLLIKLENDQFNFEIISEKPSNFPVKEMFNLKYSVTGIIFGLFLSLGIISLRRNN
jgi:hypothetical protein